MSSSTRKLKNEMTSLEENSDRYIPYDRYYIINVEVSGEFDDSVGKWAKTLLSYNLKHQPLATYTFNNTISLVFSCVEEGLEHYLSGSHHLLISHYSSLLSKELSTEVTCTIVELETRTKLLTYLSWKVHSNSKNHLLSLLKETDIMSKTQNEIFSDLKKIGIEWDDIPAAEIYGVFSKLKKKNNKVVISSISEVFDARNEKRYSDFIFGEV